MASIISKFVFETFKTFLLYNESYTPIVRVTLLKSITELPHTIKSLLEPSNYVPIQIVQPSKIQNIYHIESLYDKTTINIYYGVFDEKFFDVKRLLSLVHMYIFFLNKLNFKNRIDILLTLFNDVKTIPSKLEVLSAKHINSGLRVLLSSSESLIFIYRKEEFEKVLLHELMHHYDMDYYDVNKDNEALKKIQSKIHLQTNRLGLHEVYNDTMTILFLIGIKILMKNALIKSHQYEKQYAKYLLKSKAYMLLNAAKILKYYKKKSLFDKNPIIEETHVFSYYIGKAATFGSIEEFYDIIPKSIVLNNNNEHITKFINYFVEKITSVGMNRLLIDEIHLLSDVNNKKFLSTLRMSNADI